MTMDELKSQVLNLRNSAGEQLESLKRQWPVASSRKEDVENFSAILQGQIQAYTEVLSLIDSSSYAVVNEVMKDPMYREIED